jgi:hypothetical protein
MMNRKYGMHPVYCLTPAAFCIDDNIYLGDAPVNTPLRCPICGRWSTYNPAEGVKRRNENKGTCLNPCSLSEMR